jgi:hypothetical protein
MNSTTQLLNMKEGKRQCKDTIFKIFLQIIEKIL